MLNNNISFYNIFYDKSYLPYFYTGPRQVTLRHCRAELEYTSSTK